jgi:hypothetical protein
MAAEKKEKRVTLSAQDKEAAKRLYADAYKAIAGLAKIAATALDVTLNDNHRLMFKPKFHRSQTEREVLEFKGIEITCDGRYCICIDKDNEVAFFCYAEE